MRLWILTLALVLTPALVTAQNAHDLLQEAAYQERALGDLERANELYTLILERHAVDDRELAARSLFQLAVNHESLGHTVAARQALQRLVAEFPEQERLVAEAVTRGAVEGSAQDVTHRVIWDMNDTSGLTDGGPSPDSRYLSFAHWPSGNLAIKDLETGEITFMTNEATWDPPSRFADNSVWSRDGSAIAFVWWDGDQAFLKVVDVATKAIHTVAEEYMLPTAWTSDGHILVFWGDAEGTRMALVSADDASVDVIHQPESERRMGLFGSLSPDDRWVAFRTIAPGVTGPSHLYVMPSSGGDPVPLAPHPGYDTNVYWEADGRGVVFTSDRSGTESLWRVDVVDGQQGGEPELVFGDMRKGYSRGFDASGKLYVEKYQSESTGNLYAVAFDSDAMTVSAEPVRMPLMGIDYNAGASFSDDGRYMAYVSQRPSGVLVVRDLTTGREVEHDLGQLRLLKHRVDKPQWRPGTHELLVATFAGPLVIDAMSGETTEAIWANDVQYHRPSWSPDGSRIWGMFDRHTLGYVETPGAGNEISLNDASAQEIVAVRHISEDQYCEGPAVNPADGKVAYWCDYDTIYRLDPETGETTEWWRVPEGEPWIAHNINGSFAFTPDGSNLLFHRWRQGEDADQSRIWRLPVDGANPVPVSGLIPHGWGFELHPSGNQAVYTVLDGAKNEMWVLEGIERD